MNFKLLFLIPLILTLTGCTSKGTRVGKVTDAYTTIAGGNLIVITEDDYHEKYKTIDEAMFLSLKEILGKNVIINYDINWGLTITSFKVIE